MFKRKENLGPLSSNKRRKIGETPMVGPNVSSRGRQPLPNPNAAHTSQPPPADPNVAAAAAGSDANAVEFNSREDVERVLNEKMKGKNKNDYKGKSEQMSEYIKKLRTCIRWLIEREDGNLTEQEKLQRLLESEEKRHVDNEAQMRSNIEELKAKIEELRRQYESMQELFRKEESDKTVAIKSYEEEKEVRIAVEKSRDAVSEELVKAGHEAKRLDDQIKVLEASNKRLHEYNTSLQQYNCNLQAEVAKNGETISKLNEEKNSMMGTLTGLRNNTTSMKTQLDSYRSLQQEAAKQKEDLRKEVTSLRIDLQQVRDDRDQQLAQVQSLVAEIANYKELTGKSAMEVEKTMTKANVLEETCSSQRERIQALLHELAVSKEKLKMSDLTAMQTMTEFEEQKDKINNLQNRLADAEYQIVEAEKFRKELHNTILELKGNIRVFCRVRPALPESDSSSSDDIVVTYPTSTELRGRGIDLIHNTKTVTFAFDKVFNHEASQEDVFVEISQLVQSALDGYKVCIFAYGQTGSGKTYTMMGMNDSPQQKGLIPRSLEQIFQISQSKLSQGWKYKMQASMLEIYNEAIRDLLSSNRSCSLDVKYDSNGHTYVPGLTIVDVCSINEVSYLLQRAAQSSSLSPPPSLPPRQQPAPLTDEACAPIHLADDACKPPSRRCPLSKMPSSAVGGSDLVLPTRSDHVAVVSSAALPPSRPQQAFPSTSMVRDPLISTNFFKGGRRAAALASAAPSSSTRPQRVRRNVSSTSSAAAAPLAIGADQGLVSSTPEGVDHAASSLEHVPSAVVPATVVAAFDAAACRAESSAAGAARCAPAFHAGATTTHGTAPSRPSFAQVARGPGFVRTHANSVTAFGLVPDLPIFPSADMHNGFPSLHFSEQEVSNAESVLGKAAIVKFLSGRPTLEECQATISASWALSGRFSIGLLDTRTLLVRFELDADLIAALTRENMYLKNFPYKIYRWNRKFDVREDASLAPVWISLPMLPVVCFIPSILTAIGNRIGKYLKVDLPTATLTRPSVARICVEVDLRKSLPSKLWMGIDDGFWQPIKYERLPHFCVLCNIQGHSQFMCKRQARLDAAELSDPILVQVQDLPPLGGSGMHVDAAAASPGAAASLVPSNTPFPIVRAPLVVVPRQDKGTEAMRPVPLSESVQQQDIVVLASPGTHQDPDTVVDALATSPQLQLGDAGPAAHLHQQGAAAPADLQGAAAPAADLLALPSSAEIAHVADPLSGISGDVSLSEQGAGTVQNKLISQLCSRGPITRSKSAMAVEGGNEMFRGIFCPKARYIEKGKQVASVRASCDEVGLEVTTGSFGVLGTLLDSDRSCGDATIDGSVGDTSQPDDRLIGLVDVERAEKLRKMKPLALIQDDLPTMSNDSMMELVKSCGFLFTGDPTLALDRIRDMEARQH